MLSSPTQIKQIQILFSLFSPSFPVGAFSYSHGMEAAIAKNFVVDAETTYNWIETCLIGGSGRNDAIIMSKCWRNSDSETYALNELAFAICSSRERALETSELGKNFVKISSKIYDLSWQLDLPIAYPVAAGIATKQLKCGLQLSLAFFLQAFVCNLISVAVRALPLGQTEGQFILRRLLPAIEDIAGAAASCKPMSLGGYAFFSDYAAKIHEGMETKVYRT